MLKQVTQNIDDYFKRHDMNYTAVDVWQTDDRNIYVVLAKHLDYSELKRIYGGGEYVVWTCWNEATQSLNFGHYDLTLKNAVKFLEDKLAII